MAGALARRRYDSPKRRARADATRARLLDAAARLFARKGYAGATMDAIATKAGVAPPTLYAVFGSKAALAHALIARLKEDAAVRERFAALGRAPTAREKLRISAEITTAYSRLGWAILEALRTIPASEKALLRVWRDAEASRRGGQRTIIEALAAEGILRADLTEEEALDVLFALSAHDTYRLYVEQCGWSPERFEAWLARTTEALLVSRHGSKSYGRDRLM